MRIVDRIIELANENNMSINQTTMACNIQHNAITIWKTGKAKPSIDALLKIADYFNVSLDYLVGREAPMITAENQRNTTYDVTTAPLLNEWNNLTELQRQKVLTYINDIKGVNNNAAMDVLRKAEASGKERATKEVYMQRQKKDV